jgi:putative endonuclease
MKVHGYYVYIITNLNKTVLYTGMTNDLFLRLQEHRNNTHIRNRKTFSGRYRCQFLLYYEQFQFVKEAYDREKEIKGWSRAKKEALINSVNQNWNFLDPEVAAG